MEEKGRLTVKKYVMLNEAWPHSYEKPSEKGYPEIFNLMDSWVLFFDNEPIGYTGSLDMGEFHFIGNTYILPHYRKSGYHTFLLSERNNQLGLKPKITILNPIEESQMYHLVKVVQSLGYNPVYLYDDVKDIMSNKMYSSIFNPNQQIWRMN